MDRVLDRVLDRTDTMDMVTFVKMYAVGSVMLFIWMYVQEHNK